MTLVLKRKRRVAAYPYHVYLSDKHVVEVKKGGLNIGIYLITPTNRRRGVVLPLSAWEALQDSTEIINLAIDYAKGIISTNAEGYGEQQRGGYGEGGATSFQQYQRCIEGEGGNSAFIDGFCPQAGASQNYSPYTYYPSIGYFTEPSGSQLCSQGGAASVCGPYGDANATTHSETTSCTNDINTAAYREGWLASYKVRDIAQTSSGVGECGGRCDGAGADFTIGNLERLLLQEPFNAPTNSNKNNPLDGDDPAKTIHGQGGLPYESAYEEFSALL